MPKFPLAAALALVVSFAAVAEQSTQHPTQHFRWRDAQGELHYADLLPADALKSGYDVVDDRGLLIRRVEGTRTPEQLKAAQEAAEQAASAKRAANEQARRDRQLLAAYPSEDELQIAHREQLASLDQNIHTDELNLKNQERALSDLLAHAADIEHGGKPVPKFIADKIAEQRQAVADQRNTLDQHRAERAETAMRLDQELAHYRALRAQREAEYGGS
ncbi:MAG: DUF4124 domain-containing protein [Mizugakiibacter sp.]|uniref:DUF4124 domain-containing protein n=1 Tax=Mizugakiibacter sp. TaxID=1972610 RepID=UPI0031C39BBE|nr:DUF4124 domain-containing protein [Xanthomonadaceae bacterium]